MRRDNNFAVCVKAIMRPVVSLTMLSAALIVILSERYDPNSKHWAYATVGTIMGFG
jgi:hypothetical protein